ncbi:MAG: HAD family hydrolase, partial [Pseudomonadales bacterium]
MDAELLSAAAGIRLLALDVDGVLTDGRIHYTSTGEELKSFSILDGLGIKLVRRHGISVAIIT